MIVMKFGGTSVQDAAAINQAVRIVRSRIARAPVVVVSAMARVTDALLRAAHTARERRFDEAEAITRSLRERHLATARELLEGASIDSETHTYVSVEARLRELFGELDGLVRSVATLGELTSRSQDAIASFGERLSSILVAASLARDGLRPELMDSRRFIITDSNFTSASPDMKRTEPRARDALMRVIDSGRVPVAQGFIGSTTEGVTTTIGRGGSDYTAAIIGAALGAEVIEIWTDVDGLMTADPRVVDGARRIRVISFAEAAELSYFGAKVLHPSTVLPAIERHIPVHIYNTASPASGGTRIVAEPPRSGAIIKSIAFKRGVTVVNVSSTRMLLAHGFLRAIFEVFEQHRTSVDVVTTSEVSVSITLDDTERLEAIRLDLGRIGGVSVDRDKAIVCVVGSRLKFTPGLAARLFRAIETTNVNMISQGASEINLTFVIDESSVERVVRSLHDEFFAGADPEVFD